MTQLSGTFKRPTSTMPTAVAGVALAGAIAIGAFIAGFGLGSRAAVPQAAAPDPVAAPVAAPATTREAILGSLQSEYLRGIAGSWYLTPGRAGSGLNENLLLSDYLREIARDW